MIPPLLYVAFSINLGLQLDLEICKFEEMNVRKMFVQTSTIYD